jgi:hypothetical protein
MVPAVIGISVAVFAATTLHGGEADADAVCPPDAVSAAATEPPGPPAGRKELAAGWSWPMSSYRLVIPAIDLDEAIADRGVSSALDAGHVVNLTGCWPDSSCTVYLAGHNTTHGAVFNLVDDLDVGDDVTVATPDMSQEYVIDSKTVVCRHTTTLADAATGDLVLQTSHGGHEVWILRATVAAGVAPRRARTSRCSERRTAIRRVR